MQFAVLLTLERCSFPHIANSALGQNAHGQARAETQKPFGPEGEHQFRLEIRKLAQ
jgi:hypothetical protein